MNACAMISSPDAGGSACAASVVAARAATCRAVKSAGHARTQAKRRLARTAATHRRNVAQPSAAVFPRIFHGLVRARTAGAESCTTPNRASAQPIAEAVYRRCDLVSCGVTVMLAPHRHRYRRTKITVCVARSPGAGGPNC